MHSLPLHYCASMAPQKDRKPRREEIEVAYSTKALSRKLQRKLLQRRLDDFSDGSAAASEHHSSDGPAARNGEPPREDRAG